MVSYEQQTKKIIAEKSGIELAEITEDSFFEDDLNMGELELVDLLTELEDSFEIEGIIDQKDDIETVGDLFDVLSDKLE